MRSVDQFLMCPEFPAIFGVFQFAQKERREVDMHSLGPLVHPPPSKLNFSPPFRIGNVLNSVLFHSLPKMCARFVLPLVLPFALCFGCKFGGVQRNEGEHWVHRNFNVTCLNGRIKVLNCVTDRGTLLQLGTKLFVEDETHYSCRLNFRTQSDDEQEGEGQEGQPEDHQQPAASSEPVPECDESDSAEYMRNGFVVSCRSHQILGCLDVRGDLVKTEQFYLLSKGRLRRCEVYARGRWAKSERKGCFNGTLADDPSDTQFHVPFGRVWQSGEFEWRCGDGGVHVYKCLIDGRRIHTSTAWVDRENVLNVCI